MTNHANRTIRAVAERYDHIVIGAGLGGLSAAAYLARAGHAVLVVDRCSQPGGLATTIVDSGFSVTHCPFLLWGAYEGGWTYEMFEELDILGQVSMVPVDPLSSVRLPDETFTVPALAQDAVSALARRFPNDAEGIARLFADFDSLVDDWHRDAPDLTAIPRDSALQRFVGLTFDEVLDRYVSTDPNLRAIVSSSWVHWGLPPSQVSGLLAALLVGFGHRGMRTLVGGPSTLSDALAARIVELGGEILLNTAVTAIRVEGGTATGVELDSGRVIAANSIISNAPASHTYLDLVGRKHLTAGSIRELRSLLPSMSAFQILLGTDLDMTAIPGLAAENTVLDHVDQDEVFYRALRGDFTVSFTVFCASLVDRTAAPPGLHCLKILGAGPVRRRGLDWGRDGSGIADQLIRAAERVVPGLADHIVWRHEVTPLDLAERMNSPVAAIYGWGATPQQIGDGRSARTGAIRGLNLAGAWTAPFAGMDLCLLSGRTTAQLLLQGED